MAAPLDTILWSYCMVLKMVPWWASYPTVEVYLDSSFVTKKMKKKKERKNALSLNKLKISMAYMRTDRKLVRETSDNFCCVLTSSPDNLWLLYIALYMYYCPHLHVLICFISMWHQIGEMNTMYACATRTTLI